MIHGHLLFTADLQGFVAAEDFLEGAMPRMVISKLRPTSSAKTKNSAAMITIKMMRYVGVQSLPNDRSNKVSNGRIEPKH